MIVSKLVILCVLAAVIVASVRFLVVPGIDSLSRVFGLSGKARGQLLGYAISTPELVIIVASAASGVFDAGFWNIASSNIINWVLFMSAVLFWGQFKDLKKRPFRDELLFGGISVVIPLILFMANAQGSLILALGLVALFGIYRFLDRRWNGKARSNASEALSEDHPARGILLLVLGLGVIVGAGWKLGSVTEELVVSLGIASWVVGWILGFISSIPEMSGFFEVYRKHHVNKTLHGLRDTQEVLESLVASNMGNLCIILPLGVLVLILF